MNASHLWRIALGLLCCAVSAIGIRASDTIVSEKGASLRVRWSSPATARAEKISLLPIDVAFPAGLTRDEAIRAWTRPITGSDVRWDALPPGTYQIVMRAADPIAEASVPIDVGEIILSPGDDRVLSIVLPPTITAIERSPALALRVLVSETTQDSESLSVAQWRDGVRTVLATTQQPESGGALLTMPAACIPGSVVMIETPTRIGAGLVEGACEKPIRVELIDRATQTARLSVPSGVRLPRSGSLRFAKCASVATTVDIPFAISDSRMRASVPAGCGDMTLRVAGFVPVKRPIQPSKAGENRDLGTIALVEGAAAVLRVRAGGDATPLKDVQIRAVRPSDLSTMRGDLDATPVTLGETISDASGWARLNGLPEGRVIFLLRAAGRMRPQVSEPYELLAGEETVIDDLVVETPANVFVTVLVPPHLEGAIELHMVELAGTGHTHWPSRVPMSARPGPAGAVVEDVPPGTWKVRATGRLKNGFALRLAETTIDVAAGVDRHVTLTLTDELYHGRVTRGGLAISGTINLKPADRSSNHRAAVAKLGADGEFQVLLESRGHYSVSVQDATRATVRLGRSVSFDDPADEIEIELPTGQEIRGRVVDGSGTPVAGVSVGATEQLVESGSFVGVTSSADGTFTLEGVVSGRWELVAESKDYRSAPRNVDVGEGDVEDITLVVDTARAVKVRVVDVAGAPVRMVNVTTVFLPPGASHPQFYGSLTRATGEAEFRLSRAQQTTPTSVVLQSMSDGMLSCAMRTLDSDQTVPIATHGGEVRLVASRWMAKAGAQNWLVSASGCAVPFFARVEGDAHDRQAMVFRRLATGTWKYVETHNPHELTAVLEGRGSSLIPIKTFVVEAGTVTRVDLRGAQP